jgi:hypothetical protein
MNQSPATHPLVPERTARILGWVARGLWLAALIAFHLWNICHYDPISGYDALDHLRVIATYHETGHAPAGGYGALNPPLYYIVMGGIWGLTQSVKALHVWELTSSLKVLQVVSLLLYGVNVWIVKKLLWTVTRNPWVRWPALTFVAYLPVHIAYAYMIFNYSLSHTLELGTIYALYSFARRPQLQRLVAAGVLAGLGAFTALTCLYTVPLGALTAFVYGPRALRRRLLWLGAFLLAFGVATLPFYRYQKNQACYLCTGNRAPTNKPFTKVYPPGFYTHFSFRALKYPYYPNHFYDGMWNLIYETTFADYFGYLVPPRLTDFGAPQNKTGLVSTGRHFIDRQLLHRAGLLSLSALPSALAILIALAVAGYRSADWLVRVFRTRARAPLSLFVFAGSVAVLAQYLAYIHRYPNWVNLHAGYLLAILVLATVEVTRLLRWRWARGAMAVAFSGYAAGCVFVFLFR